MKEMGEGLEPLAIFTDADLAAESAMNQVFPASDKYRCFWHLKQNITKNLHGALGPENFETLMANFTAAAFALSERQMRAKWERVMEASSTCAAAPLTPHVRWRMCTTYSLTMHLTSPPHLASDVAAEQVARASDAKRRLTDNDDKSAARYMSSILLDERRWAFFYRRGRFTLGIASTQRCESFFNKLKTALGHIGTLRHLVSVLVRIMEGDDQETRIITGLLGTRASTSGLRKVSAPGACIHARVYTIMCARS
jgi:MULE transposase domain